MNNQAEIVRLQNLIDRADQAYYNVGESPLSDEAYDAAKAELKRLAPNDPRHARVGAVVPRDSLRQKFKHTAFMGSLNKCDNLAGLAKWHKSGGNGAIHCSLKLDGASACAYYEDGKLVRFVTRGGDDGVGEDVTANALNFHGVPSVLSQPATCAVRGEVILPVAEWRKLDPTEHSNPRNLGTGMMLRSDGTGAKHLHFIAFDAEVEGSTFGQEKQKGVCLEQLGFATVSAAVCDKVTDAIAFYNRVAVGRASLSYWIDGIVFKFNDLTTQRRLGVKDNRPRGQTVLKFEAEGAETVLEKVVLTVGRRGDIIPTAKVKPVKIGGTTVSSALLNNFKEIEELDVAIGDKVRVIKAKDIVPKLVEVIERPAGRQPIQVPTTCPVCGGPVAWRELTTKNNGNTPLGRVLECKNDQCTAKAEAKIKCWIEKQDILGIGGGVLVAMIEELNVETPADLYRLTPERLAPIKVGAGVLGAKRAAAIVEQIQQRRTMTVDSFIGSLGIPFLGRSRVKLMREALPGELDTVADWQSGKLRTSAVKEGASVQNMADHMQDAIDTFEPVIADLLNYITVISQEKKQGKPMTTATGGKLAGMKFVFTGKIEKVGADGKRFTRDMMHKVVQDNGGAVDDKVRAGVTHLVQADKNSTSSKTQAAQKLGTKIISEAEFFQMVEG